MERRRLDDALQVGRLRRPVKNEKVYETGLQHEQQRSSARAMAQAQMECGRCPHVRQRKVRETSPTPGLAPQIANFPFLGDILLAPRPLTLAKKNHINHARLSDHLIATPTMPLPYSLPRDIWVLIVAYLPLLARLAFSRVRGQRFCTPPEYSTRPVAFSIGLAGIIAGCLGRTNCLSPS